MRRGFFARLAAGNIKKNGNTYFPYILTCTSTVMLYYIVKSLSLNPGLEEMTGDRTLISLMEMGAGIISLFSLIFLFYTNSFLLKRRKKEFGVFHILGLGKRHLAGTLAWESLYVFLSMACGLLFGIALDKIMFLAIAKLVRAEISLGFFISGEAVWSTVRLFAVIFLLIFLNAVRQIQVATPVGLLRDSQAGEREPKTKWPAALLGFLCVGTGYYLAITTKNPISSIYIFFIAVALVVVGTYLLFTAGSIAFLKLLRSNKAYYYKTGHFISVSGMIYRMKQNAVGLAKDLQHLSDFAFVLAGDHHHLVVFMNTKLFHSLGSYSTSGARDTIFMKLRARSSRATGPKIRVPTGSPCLVRSTAAFVSNLM